MILGNHTGDDVVRLLASAGFRSQADELRDLLTKARSPDATERASACAAIQQRCHPRWLGDLFIPGLSLQEWWTALEHLAKSVSSEARSATHSG